MRISDWSSDVCSSDLGSGARACIEAARSLCLSHVQRCFIEPIWQPEGHPPPPLGSRLRGALAGPRPLRFFAARAGQGNRAETRGSRGPAEAALAEDRAALSDSPLLTHCPGIAIAHIRNL